MAPNPKKSYLGIYEHPLVEKTLKITKPWYDALSQLLASGNSSLVAGPNKSVQYNDNGVQAGSSEFTFDNGIQQVAITANTASSQLVVQNATNATGVVGVNPRTASYEDITLGSKLNTSGDYIPNDTSASYVFRSGEQSGVEINSNLTPGTPVPFTEGVGMQVEGPSGPNVPRGIFAYEYGAGAGAVPGVAIIAQRNTDGSGAAGLIGGQLKDGRWFVIWADATGAMRYNIGASLDAIRPTESGSVSDLSGNLFVPIDSAGVTIGDGVNVISTGTAGMIYIPWSGTITANTLLSTDAAVTSGSIVIDIWKVAYGSFPPTVANTITAAAKPTLSSATHSQDTTLTGWTTAISAGDVLAYHVDSASSVKRVTLSLTVRH